MISGAEDAAAALIRFDQQAALKAAPLAAVLLRTESASSSQVELLLASSRQLGLAQLGKSRSESAQLTHDNVAALQAAAALADTPSESAMIEMHRSLLYRSNPGITGAFRSVPVWVGGPTPHLAEFVGASVQQIVPAMVDLIQFMKRVDLPRLAQIALAHAQFLTIHPFEDGNGRTGRVLIHAMLRNLGLTSVSAIPISAGLLANRDLYFSALQSFRSGDAGPIIETVIDSAFMAIGIAAELFSKLEKQQRLDRARIKTRSDAAAYRLIEYLPEYPAINSRKTQELLGISEPAALAGLLMLEQAGILVPESNAKRGRIWLAPSYLALWESFAPSPGKTKPRSE